MPMTLSDAFRAGHLRLRREPWNKFAHIEIIVSPLDREHHAMWVRLHDVVQMVEGTEPMVLDLISAGAGEAVWEPWVVTAELRECQPGVDWDHYEATQRQPTKETD